MAHLRAVVVVPFLLLVLGEGGFVTENAPVPFYDGLGSLARKVATTSPEAQRYFDQGLAFLYAFNHDEAIRAFRRAGQARPEVRDGLVGRRGRARPAHQQPGRTRGAGAGGVGGARPGRGSSAITRAPSSAP